MEANFPMDEQDRVLGEHLYRWDCPTAQELGEYNLGLASTQLMAAVEQHLTVCSRCADDLQELRHFLADDSVPKSAPRQQPATRQRHMLRDIIAVLLPPKPRYAGIDPKFGGVARVNDTIFIVEREAIDEHRFKVGGRIMADDLTPWRDSTIQVRVEDRLLGVAVVSNTGAWSYASVEHPAVDLRFVPESGPPVVIHVPEELPPTPHGRP
jgi:hypothetical protein